MDGFVSPQFLHNPRASVSTVGYGDDRGVHVQFDDEFVKNEFQSEQQGRTVFDHYYAVELQWPGDNTKTYKYRFSKEEGLRGNQWTERFPKQWEAFKSSKEQVPDGTPIEMWPPLDKKRVFELKAIKIYTVEQIAAMSDANGTKLGLDWRKLRDQAIAFLNPAESTVKLSQLMRENEDKDRRMAALEQQIASLRNSIATPVNGVDEIPSEPKRRGRPPKDQSTAA